MDPNQPGPSKRLDSDALPSKRAKKMIKTPWKRNLTEDELERLLYNSDEDVDELEMLANDEEEDSEPEDDGREPEEETVDHFDDELTQGEEHSVIEDPINTPSPSTGQINWKKTGEMENIPFESIDQFLVPFPGNQPMDIFNILVDEELCDLVVTETNNHAENIFLEYGSQEHSRMSQWKPLTVEEFRIFLGLIFHMGTINLPRIADYWKTDRLFNIPCFRESMSRDRFLNIFRCLHFVRNPLPTDPKPEDRIYKIRPLVNYFNNKIATVYYPQKNVCIDESMVLWRGRLSFRQYIPNKRHKYGVKFYMLTEPSGIILKFLIYTGSLGDFGGTGHAANVVLHLLEGKLGIGHSVYMDNFYNSYDLCKQLLDSKTFSTGTLRVNRKKFPLAVKEAKLRKGETTAEYANGVMVGKWRDKRDVTYVSTEFQNNLIQYFDKRGNQKTKPLPIVKYNENMGGIDRQDQYLAYYPCHRKTLRWYKKIAVHIFQLLLINSHLFYKKYVNSRMSFYDFRLEIIRNLLPQRPAAETPKILTHFISHCPKVNGKTMRKRCKFCSGKGLRKDTPFECKACNAGFCLEPCFEKFHRSIM